MSDYTITTYFNNKDSLPSGDANKIIKGTEFHTEFSNISTAIATKANIAGPTFTGTTTIATLSVSEDATVTGTLEAGTIDGGTY